MSPKTNDSEIACSDYFYNLTNFLIVTFVSGMLFAIPFLISSSMSKYWIAICTLLAFVLSFFIASFFYLNTVKFYIDGIEIKYFIKHNFTKTKYIATKNITALKFAYSGGRGSGGNGVLKTYYKFEGRNKILRTSMDRKSAAKLFLELNKQEITLEVVPVWVLSEFGFTPVTNEFTKENPDRIT